MCSLGLGHTIASAVYTIVQFSVANAMLTEITNCSLPVSLFNQYLYH